VALLDSAAAAAAGDSALLSTARFYSSVARFQLALQAADRAEHDHDCASARDALRWLAEADSLQAMVPRGRGDGPGAEILARRRLERFVRRYCADVRPNQRLQRSGTAASRPADARGID
jgi:hypothetical protein